MNHKVEISGVDTSKLKVLSNKEMNELFIKMQNGSKEAKEELINGNLKLVLSILKRFNNSKYNMDDLFQIGCVGLIKAVDNFDLSFNCLFSTYAVPLILGEVKRYIRDSGTIRISRSIKDLAYNIINYKDEYFNNCSKFPSDAEICQYFNITSYELALSTNSLKETVSIFEPIYNDGGESIYLLDQLAEEKSYDQDIIISINKALKQIKKREREILLSRFLVGKTQMEIAKSLNISQAQVSRLEKSAISNIKKLIK